MNYLQRIVRAHQIRKARDVAAALEMSEEDFLALPAGEAQGLILVFETLRTQENERA